MTCSVVIITVAGRAFCAGAKLPQGGKTFNCAPMGEAARDAYKLSAVCRDDGGITTLCLFKNADDIPWWGAPPFECSAGGPAATAA